jgi:hypothetical protein
MLLASVGATDGHGANVSALSIGEHAAAIATILRMSGLSKTLKLWHLGQSRPATNLASDILLPRANNSIATGQVGHR